MFSIAKSIRSLFMNGQYSLIRSFAETNEREQSTRFIFKYTACTKLSDTKKTIYSVFIIYMNIILLKENINFPFSRLYRCSYDKSEVVENTIQLFSRQFCFRLFEFSYQIREVNRFSIHISVSKRVSNFNKNIPNRRL